MLFKNELGKDIFNQMFDMELSRHITDGKSGSLSEILYRSMERLIEAKYKDETNRPEIKPLNNSEKDKFKPIKDSVPINQFKDDPLKELKVDKLFHEIRVSGRSASPDSILADYGAYINSAAKATSLDPALIYSVIKVESGGDPKAVSRAGAKGLMQLTDSTATELGVKEVFDPEQNIKAGSRYLGGLIKRFGTLELGLAAYNAGPGTVSRYGGVPPFKETQQYIQKVTDTLSRIEQNRNGHAKVKHY
jgi:soluble lytic murein transglycosylase-like protein